MEIREYIEILGRRKWVAVLTTIVTVTVVGLGSYLMTPVYSASTMVRIAQVQDSSIDYYALSYSERLINTYTHLLKSRPFLEEVIQRLDLNMLPEDLAKRIKIEALANTELIEITAESTNPRQAMSIASTLATLLIEQRQKVYSGQGKTAREILQEQLTIVEENLRENRALLQSLRNDNTGQDQAGRIQDLNTRIRIQELAIVEEDLREDTTLLQSLRNDNTGQDQAGRIQDLITRIRIQEQTYAMLLDEYEEARVGEVMRANSISVVEPAVLPNVPSNLHMKLSIALGALVGLVGGIGLAFLLENLDPAIHSADDLEAVAEVPVLGWIPSFTSPRKSRHGTTLLDGDGRSPAGEAFRILRSNIISLASGTPPKTLLITSAEPGAGKSTVLANVAAVMAQAGRKVVVVDTNLRHPCLHQVFDLPNELGLSNIILAPSEVSAVLQETKIQGVSVLTSGPLPPNPAELLGSSKMRKLIKELAEEANMVLLDSPPILAVADATVLTPMVDGVLLVAARDQATGRRVQRALQQMDRVGVRTLGLVFNKAKPGDGDYYCPYYSDGTEGAKSVMHLFRG
ncbi:MAG: polysaccharide biosynthesis tyrosine autokinase [Anaerolineae bacterium]